MPIRQTVLVSVLLLLVATSPTSSSEIRYQIRFGPDLGTFELTAEASADTFGIAQYAVGLSGALTIDHKSPVAAFAQGAGGPVDFNFARSAYCAVVVSAAQDVTSVTSTLFYNIGKSSGSLSSYGPLFGASEGVDYSLPVVLATRTYTPGTLPMIGEVDGLVFTDQNRHIARPTEGFIRRYCCGPSAAAGDVMI